MKTIYSITDTTFNSDGLIITFNTLTLFKTRDLALESLRKLREAIENGKHYNETFVDWHDEDEDDTTWMKTTRKNSNGETCIHHYTIEMMPLLEDESDDLNIVDNLANFLVDMDRVL